MPIEQKLPVCGDPFEKKVYLDYFFLVSAHFMCYYFTAT